MIRKLLWIVAGAILLGAAVAVAIFIGLFEKSVVAKDINQPLTGDQMKDLAKRGAYVAVAADCYACHTAKGGAPWAGGLPLKTPFGTIYTTNISPDKDSGIGSWTRAEFHRALRDGVGKDGHLYPAMPYASYRNMAPDDVDAVYAYLMTREPMKVANKQNALGFPFSIRQGLTFWNLFNLRSDVSISDPARSATWNRGRYLADALAHCGECHTPRNVLQGMRQEAYLQGAVIEGASAPDITRGGLTQMGFTPSVLATFMKSGLSAQGAMTGPMFEVLHFSTQYMTPDDLSALSAYLFNLDDVPKTQAPTTSTPTPVAAELAASAKPTYLALCSGCHGDKGQGIPHVVVPLDTNASLRLTNARNLIRAVVEGIPAQKFPGLERMQPMPGFGNRLNDHQLANLVNWMRMSWGNQESKLTPYDVKQLRQGDLAIPAQ